MSAQVVKLNSSKLSKSEQKDAWRLKWREHFQRVIREDFSKPKKKS